MTEQTTPEQTPAPEYSKEFVDKLLTEKKNAMQAVAELKQKANAYEVQFKEQEEVRLKEQNKWQEISEIKAKEAEEWKAKLIASETKLQTKVKVGAVKREFEKLGVRDGKMVEKVLGLIKLDSIKYDEATETVIGADEEVRRIKEDIPQIFTVQNAAGTNHNAPATVPSDVSIESYNKMVMSPEWRKMSKQDQQAFTAKVYEKLGVAYTK